MRNDSANYGQMEGILAITSSGSSRITRLVLA